MKITQLKPQQIVKYRGNPCSVLAVVRAPFLHDTGENKLGSFVKLCPIKPFVADKYVRVESDATYQGQPYVRDIRGKFCTNLSFDENGECADISTVQITIE